MGIFIRALAVPFFRFAAPVFEQAGAWTFRRTFGAVITRLWPFIRRGSVGGVLGLSALTFVRHAAERDTSGEGIALQKRTALWFHAAAELSWQLGHTIAHNATTTLGGFETLTKVKVPKLVRARTAALAATLSGVAVGVRSGERERTRDHVNTARFLRWLATTLAGAIATLELILRHAGTLALPAPVALPRARDRALSDAITARFGKLLRAVRPGVWAGLIAAPVLWILTRRIPWFQCRNVDKLGRRLCGMNGSLLDALLLDTLAIVGTLSLIEFVEECQRITPAVAEVMGKLIREAPKGL